MMNEKYLLYRHTYYIFPMSNFIIEYLTELGFKHAFTAFQLFSEMLLQQKKVGAEYLQNLSPFQEWSNKR